MTPQPMSDAEIEAAAMRLAECMDYPWQHMPEQGRENMRKHARAIVAPTVTARDAQWREMLGEPVAWSVEVGTKGGDADLWKRKPTKTDEAVSLTLNNKKLGRATPLYAIKETP